MLLISATCWMAAQVGPFYPFDNGPNGFNTLLGNQWIARRADR
jgi:hypothetical protein